MHEPAEIRERATFSVGAKLAGATIAIVIFVAAGLLVALSRYERSSLLSAKEKSALMLARLNSDSVSASVVFDDGNGISEVINNLARNDEVLYAGVWAVDADEPSKLGPLKAEFRRGKTNIEAPAKPSHSERIRATPDWVLVETPVLDPRGKVVGMAQAAFSLAPENAAIRSIERRFLALSIALSIVLTSALMMLARRIIVRPLARLAVAARSLEVGKPAQIAIGANDEIGSLAHALRAMSAAIENREQRLSQRNQDMSLVLENVEEGFLMLDRSGKMGAERSRILDTWFGVPPAEASLVSYLKTIDRHLSQWFEIAWEAVIEDYLPLELTLFQLPSSFQCNGKSYAIRYRPILEAEQLVSMLVVISDVTERIERERAELSQREMVAIFRQLVLNRSAFEQFHDEAESRLSSIESAAAEDEILVNRQLHTLKGNCAMFGIQSVASACHEIESRIKETGAPIVAAEKERLRALWTRVLSSCEQFGERTRAGSVELDEAEYSSFVEALRARLDHGVLRKIVASWKYESAAQRLNRLSEQIEHLAARLNRAPVEVERVPTTMRLPPKRWSPFWSVFTHVLRNSVDHGIELAEEREAAGKPPGGRVRLAIELESDEVVVSIADDGRGIAWDKLAQKAMEHGLPAASEADLIEAMFTDGISSCSEVTETSGRGVGMSAVQATVLELDGRIEVSSQRGKGTSFRFIFPRSMLDELSVSVRPSVLPKQLAAESLAS